MPGPLAEVKVHLVELDDGYLLVDTGWNTPESFAALESGLAERGVGWRDIRTVVVTHLHPDHAGNVQAVLDRSGARYLMHRVDAENLALVAAAGRSPFFDEAWRLAGVPIEVQQKLDQRMREYRRSFPARPPDWPLEGGERLAVKGGTLEVVWTPGHSAGHICLYSPEHRYLIAGDHLLEFITPNIGWRPGEDMLARFLDSLEGVEQLAIECVIPSHGEAFGNPGAWIAHARTHHQTRCDKIMTQLGGEALTVHQLVERMWNRRLGLMDHNFAVLEILAHVEYLRRRGPVTAEGGPDGAILWGQAR